MTKSTLTKILLNCCTHGDEMIGKFIFDNFCYGSNSHFEWKSLIANPEAMFLNQRFAEQDLNRSFPGLADGNYEQKRAFKLMEIFPKYDFVIDFHQTFAQMEDCVFISKSSDQILELVQYIKTPKVVFMQDGYENGKCTVADWTTGFAIEYARRASFELDCEVVKEDIENMLNQKQKFINKEFYQMFGRIGKDKQQELALDWQDWQEISQVDKQKLGLPNEKKLYPIFIGERAYEQSYCVLVASI